MRIVHSPVMNEFISFWFETFVDGDLQYETFFDYLKNEWYTCPAGVDGKVLLRGGLSNEAQPDSIKSEVEAAIRDGRI